MFRPTRRNGKWSEWKHACDMAVRNLPSAKRARKPLWWKLLSERKRTNMVFWVDDIGEGLCPPQTFRRSGESLLGPSNTCTTRQYVELKFRSSRITACYKTSKRVLMNVWVRLTFILVVIQGTDPWDLSSAPKSLTLPLCFFSSLLFL